MNALNVNVATKMKIPFCSLYFDQKKIFEEKNCQNGVFFPKKSYPSGFISKSYLGP